MDDSNNHYMKLISPSNNKTLVTPEKRQNSTAHRLRDITAFEDKRRGEQRRDRETERRPVERKKERERESERGRNEKGKGGM